MGEMPLVKEVVTYESCVLIPSHPSKCIPGNLISGHSRKLRGSVQDGLYRRFRFAIPFESNSINNRSLSLNLMFILHVIRVCIVSSPIKSLYIMRFCIFFTK